MNVLILGINGGFGSLFTERLTDNGIVVNGTDLADCPSPDIRCTSYITCDVTTPNEEVRTAAQQADCLLFCLPEEAVLSALETFAPMVAPGTLIVDTLSIKTPIAGIIRNIRDDIQHLSINPMFAPDVGFAGQNIAAVPIIDGAACMSFISLMKEWGSNIVMLNAEEHDKQTAITQVATHAAVLAFGRCLGKLNYDAEKALSISSPPHRMLLALLARITSKDPEVYWEIQSDNPFAMQAREALLDSLKEIDDMVRQHRQDTFREAVTANRDVLAPVISELQEISERIIKTKL